MIFLIDNYDSFTYNLFQYLGELGEEVVVKRNDAFQLEEVEKLSPDRIVISPGPGVPSQAGLSKEIIRKFAGVIPVLGVCLGHQAIAEELGGKVVLAGKLMHGKTSEIFHDGKGIFEGLPSPFTATRYHSLIVDKKSLPDCFEISAHTKEGIIMGIRHRSFLIDGVQFHPESILTAEGKKLLSNFLKFRGGLRGEML
jgi:anthranilate synthase/aminodeoxychorismate synthase-like glutamine amidotransferase